MFFPLNTYNYWSELHTMSLPNSCPLIYVDLQSGKCPSSHMVRKVLKKLDMDRQLTKYEINEFCQMKTTVDLKLDLPS